MDGLIEAINTMIENTENYCGLLLGSDLSQAAQIRPLLGEGLSAVINGMLTLYDTPEFEGVREDKGYWCAQLERIGEAIGSEDVFFTIDVLKNETVENMKLFLRMLQ